MIVVSDTSAITALLQARQAGELSATHPTQDRPIPAIPPGVHVDHAKAILQTRS